MTTLRRFNIDWDCETIVDNEMGQYCYAQEALEIFNRLRLAERSGVCETCVEESVKITDQLRADVERLKKAVVQAAVDEGRANDVKYEQYLVDGRMFAIREMGGAAERKAAEHNSTVTGGKRYESRVGEYGQYFVESTSDTTLTIKAVLDLLNENSRLHFQRDMAQRECTAWREQAESVESERDAGRKECASWRDTAEEAERELDEVRNERNKWQDCAIKAESGRDKLRKSAATIEDALAIIERLNLAIIERFKTELEPVKKNVDLPAAAQALIAKIESRTQKSEVEKADRIATDNYLETSGG